jgi:hypothetical protein
MKDETIIVLVVAAVAVFFWAASRGLFGVGLGPTGLVANPQTGVQSGAINVPQPSSNYSGYLAASTAPGVSSALNSIIGGIGGGLAAWLSPSGSNPPTVSQGASPNSPSGAAQPQTMDIPLSGTLVGPQISPIMGLSYAGNTIGSAFDYQALADANSYDSNYDLSTPAWA